MLLMVLLVLSSSVCFTKYEVEGKIESVVMENVGSDHKFVDGDMGRNKDKLGL